MMSFLSRSNKSEEKKSLMDFPVFRHEDTAAEKSAPESIISKTMVIEGDLFSDENVTIEGCVRGTIKVTRTLTIGKSGNVIANIDAGVLKILGRVKGNVRASDKVIILSEGRCEGNVWSQKLVISEGAVLNGEINQELDSQHPMPIPATQPTPTENTSDEPASEPTPSPTEITEPISSDYTPTSETPDTPTTDEISHQTPETEPSSMNTEQDHPDTSIPGKFKRHNMGKRRH